MAEASIPTDLFNPGQVFACMGFLEAADVLIGDVFKDDVDVLWPLMDELRAEMVGAKA